MLRTEAYDKVSAQIYAANKSDLPAPHYEEGEFNHSTEFARFSVPYTDGKSIVDIIEVRELGYDAVDKEFDIHGVKVVLPMPVVSASPDLDCCPACVMVPAVIKYRVVSRESKIPTGFRKASHAEIAAAYKKPNNGKSKK
jgi:hypothetical protein